MAAQHEREKKGKDNSDNGHATAVGAAGGASCRESAEDLAKTSLKKRINHGDNAPGNASPSQSSAKSQTSPQMLARSRAGLDKWTKKLVTSRAWLNEWRTR